MIAIVLTVLFDLTRITYYLVTDVEIQYGVLRNIRKKVKASPYIIIIAMAPDITVLVAFLRAKARSGLLIVILSFVIIGLVFSSEDLFLKPGKYKGNSSG